MNFIVSADTDVGISKATNQDSLSIKVFATKQGPMAFAVLCDGMGGLEKGEVASAAVVQAFDVWAKTQLPALCEAPISDGVIRAQWERVIAEQDAAIKAYGARRGVRLGTTVVAMLLTQTRYYILNVGDSRAYELTAQIRQITRDQTFVAREVTLGNMTEQQAKTDSRRSVLLQCVGASDNVYPDMFFGQTQANALYLLCCDGFIHEITSDEIFSALRPDTLSNEQVMHQRALELIERNKRRMERDNITVALIRTF